MCQGYISGEADQQLGQFARRCDHGVVPGRQLLVVHAVAFGESVAAEWFTADASDVGTGQQGPWVTRKMRGLFAGLQRLRRQPRL